MLLAGGIIAQKPVQEIFELHDKLRTWTVFLKGSGENRQKVSKLAIMP
jgi:hypothetical protein